MNVLYVCMYECMYVVLSKVYELRNYLLPGYIMCAHEGVHVYVYVMCTYIYVYIHERMWPHMHVHIHTFIHTYMNVPPYIIHTSFQIKKYFIFYYLF